MLFSSARRAHVKTEPRLLHYSSSISSVVAASSNTTLPRSTTAPSAMPSPTSSFSNPSREHVYNITVYSGTNFTGTARNYSSPGIVNFGFNAASYVWQPRRTGCCVRFCASSVDVGYRCTTATYQPHATSPFNKIILACGTAPSSEQCLEG